MTVKKTQDENADFALNPMMANSHPLLRELSHSARGIRTGKHHDRMISVFQLHDAPNHYITIPHETLVHNLSPTLSALGSSSDALAWGWVWPWDIAKFAVSAPGEFITQIGRFPHLVKGLMDSMNNGATNAANFDKVRKLQSTDKMREFFQHLGAHNDFKSQYPNAAKLCRVVGGENPGGELPTAEEINPNDQNVLKMIEAVLIAIGVISGAIGAAAVSIIGIVIGVIGLVAGASAILVGAAATALIIAAVGVIVLVLIGLGITILVAIGGLIIAGILIFGGGKSDDIDLYLEQELGLQLA
jgi:hypothetical protein